MWRSESCYDDAIETVQPALEGQTAHASGRDPKDTRLLVEVDPVRMTQVITNLLTNAVKYTPAGGLIQFERARGGAIPDHRRARQWHWTYARGDAKIFDMFTRIESETARSEGGLGIGLALAKGLACNCMAGAWRSTAQGSDKEASFSFVCPAR